jgi:hypothetical protein
VETWAATALVSGATLARRFAEVVAAVPEETARTMAWPLPGGTAEWDRIAAAAGFDPDLT